MILTTSTSVKSQAYLRWTIPLNLIFCFESYSSSYVSISSRILSTQLPLQSLYNVFCDKDDAYIYVYMLQL